MQAKVTAEQKRQAILRLEQVYSRRAQLSMLRRATIEFYFTAEQMKKILSLFPAESRVEAIVTLCSRIIDIERVRWHELTNAAQFAQLKDRLGIANLFNPMQPEGPYTLYLKRADERLVLSMLVKLITMEPGKSCPDDLVEINDIPMNMSGMQGKWLKAIPDVESVIKITFQCSKRSAAVRQRAIFARKLLIPGQGRWKAIPSELMPPDSEEIGKKLDAETEEYHMSLDGSMRERRNVVLERRKIAALMKVAGGLGGVLNLKGFKSAQKGIRKSRDQQMDQAKEKKKSGQEEANKKSNASLRRASVAITTTNVMSTNVQIGADDDESLAEGVSVVAVNRMAKAAANITKQLMALQAARIAVAKSKPV